MSRDDYRSRDRDEDRGRSRDDDRGGRSRERERDDDRGRGRDDDRGSRGRERERDDDRGRGRDDDRGGRSRGGSGFQYRARDPEKTARRGEGGGDFDKLFKDHIKTYKIRDGVNNLRILPPTWDGADHYGKDIWVHYGVGPDRGSYLCLSKMLDKADPIAEEYAELRKAGQDEVAKKMDAKRRVAVYVIDRDDEKEGVQAWAMPWTLDRDLVLASTDRRTGEVLPIDHPEEGFDISFKREGKNEHTKYLGVQVDRRSSPLGRNADEWLDYISKYPLPDQLQYYDYDHIAKAFGGGGGSRGRERERDDDRGRGRDDDRGGSRDRGRNADKDAITWDSLHEMTYRELEDVIDQERLRIDPREAENDKDLADWIADEMGLRKPASRDDDRGRDRERDEDRGRERERERDDDRGRGREREREREPEPERTRERTREREPEGEDSATSRMRSMRERRD